MREFFCVLMFVFTCNVGAANDWLVNEKQSHLYFIFDQAGSDEQGEFKQFDVQIDFDPDNLVGSKLSAVIMVGSLSTKDTDRDKILLSKDMFDQAKWSKAYFEANKIEHIKDNEYTSKATLQIKDVIQTIEFPFKVEIKPLVGQKELRLTSDLMIKRLAFGVGKGDWADVTWVADSVKVNVDLLAVKKNDK